MDLITRRMNIVGHTMTYEWGLLPSHAVHPFLHHSPLRAHGLQPLGMGIGALASSSSRSLVLIFLTTSCVYTATAPRQMFTAAVSDVTAAHEAALQSAVLNEQFPSLSARALPTVSASAIRESPGPSPRAKPRTSGNSSGGASFAAAGGIAAAALLASSRGAAEPPRATAPDAQLPFDAIFSEDEVEEMQEAGGGVGPPQQHASGPRLVTPQNSVHSMPLQDSIPPSAVVAADEGGFGPGGAPSLPSTGSEVLGTSPSTRLNTPGTQGEFYTYQAADGSWVFLHTVNLRFVRARRGAASAPAGAGRGTY